MGFKKVYHNDKPDGYCDVTCDGCETALKAIGPTGENPDEWRYLQPNNGLLIRLEGGYGMAIDPFCNDTPEQNLLKVFCGECVQKLCEQWPTFAKTIQADCSSSLGHHCSKEKKFVWRSISNCCNLYCGQCGIFATCILGQENKNEKYGRQLINCDKCKAQCRGIWAWETTIEWWVEYNIDFSNFIAEYSSGPYSSKEEALSHEKDVAGYEGIQEIWIKAIACLNF